MKQPYRSSKPQYRARVEAMQYMNQISRAYAFTNPVICSEHTWYTWQGRIQEFWKGGGGSDMNN